MKTDAGLVTNIQTSSGPYIGYLQQTETVHGSDISYYISDIGQDKDSFLADLQHLYDSQHLSYKEDVHGKLFVGKKHGTRVTIIDTNQRSTQPFILYTPAQDRTNEYLAQYGDNEKDFKDAITFLAKDIKNKVTGWLPLDQNGIKYLQITHYGNEKEVPTSSPVLNLPKCKNETEYKCKQTDKIGIEEFKNALLFMAKELKQNVTGYFFNSNGESKMVMAKSDNTTVTDSLWSYTVSFEQK